MGGEVCITTRFQWDTHKALVKHAPGFSGVGGGGAVEP